MWLNRKVEGVQRKSWMEIYDDSGSFSEFVIRFSLISGSEFTPGMAVEMFKTLINEIENYDVMRVSLIMTTYPNRGQIEESEKKDMEFLEDLSSSEYVSSENIDEIGRNICNYILMTKYRKNLLVIFKILVERFPERIKKIYEEMKTIKLYCI